jgi:predicted nucleic acid-binding protein
MKGGDRFFDTDVLLYLLSADAQKADTVEKELLRRGGYVSVQVLNEYATIAIRKLKLSIGETKEVVAAVRSACAVVPLTEETHDTGMRIAERYRFGVYDSMIVASALLAGCRTLLSEDLQDRQVIDGRLVVTNPFR